MPKSLAVPFPISVRKNRVISIAILIAACLVVPPSSAQTIQVLHSFSGGRHGSFPNGVIPGDNDRLIGTASGGPGCKPISCGIIYGLNSKGEEILIHGFTGSDGSNPNHLVPDGSGGIYGVTYTEGALGCGNVFHLNASGQFQVLYSFKGDPDGCMGNNLILGSDGTLYGTTYVGGNNSGTVFKLDLSGHESVIYAFTGGADGLLPGSSLFEAEGKLYGTTYAGGRGCLGNPGCGVVYEIDQSGKESVLYAFTDTNGDGETPDSLVRDSSGNLFGLTGDGGNTACESGCGTLFKLTQGANGWDETILYSFNNKTDGAYPGHLVAWRNNLYGTTDGGAVDGCSGAACGTIFEFDSAGNFSTLYTFTGQADGEDPSLSFVKEGTFLGTTGYGGNLRCSDNDGYGCGTVFAFTP
jgi:uncharacterized repeat protein (TIGR03803 family)